MTDEEKVDTRYMIKSMEYKDYDEIDSILCMVGKFSLAKKLNMSMHNLEKENAELKEQANTMQTSFEMYKLDVITILTSMGIKDEFLERLEQFNKICNRPWSD